jgi:hypothetical protein
VVSDPDDDRDKTESQKEWAAWAAHGYRKLYQPRSIRRFGLVWTVLFSAFFLTIVLPAVHGVLP